MKAQRAEILTQLARHGWRASPVEDHELEWWADEMWSLESARTPVGARAYVTFLVDPQIPHGRARRKGESVWAVMASPAKPRDWQPDEQSLTLSLGRGWRQRLPEFFAHLARSRAAGVSFREAAVADCLAVGRTHVRSWRESFAGLVPQAFLDKMSPEARARAFEKRFGDDSYRMYVAEAPGHGVVGFADFGDAREAVGPYEGELYAIYILRDFQRRGVGERLFRLGVEFLAGRGRRSMYLLALEVNPYRKFYEKMGGLVVGRTQTVIEGVAYDELVYGWDSLP